MKTKSEEYVSVLDTPEVKEAVKLNLRRENLIAATTSTSDQLRLYLERCNHRGSPYREGRDPYPNHTQLAEYCGCNISTIYRISTGEQRSIKTEVIDILLAVSCISPKPTVRHPGNVNSERRRRLADADAWLKRDPETRGELLEALLSGIEEREQKRERARNRKREQKKKRNQRAIK